MGPYGTVWGYMDCMGLYGAVWDSMALYGAVHVGLLGIVWDCMGLNEVCVEQLQNVIMVIAHFQCL